MNRKSGKKIETEGDYSPAIVKGDYKIIQQTTSLPDISSKKRKDIFKKYCLRIKQRYSTINLFGERRRDTSEGSKVVARMADIDYGFIPLHLTVWREDAETHETTPLEIDELFFDIKTASRFLLRGLPGSGKTTLLRYLSHRFASKCIANEKEYIPVYLRLKNLDLSKTSLEDFVKRQINEDCDSRESYDVLCDPSYFLESATVLLFDGIDEIEKTESSMKIADVLDDFAQQHPRCIIIVAARPIGLQKQAYPRYEPIDVLPLNQSMIDNYLEKWFDSSKDEIDSLQKTLGNKPRIRALATNPFLLSMICYTYEQSGDTTLIERRSELYKNCTNSLLKRPYDAESNIKSKIDFEKAIRILKDLSLRFFLWQEADFPVDYVNIIGKRVLTAKILGKTEKFLDNIQRKTGLIQKSKDGFAFVHRSLWEYFTALALLDRRIDFVIRHAANPDWEEVVRLYAGLLPNHDKVVELVNGLWNLNRPLALRVTTEVKTPAAELLNPLIKKEAGNQSKLLLIDALEQSLHLIAATDQQKLVQETLDILLIKCAERDCEVIYHAQELLEKLGMQPLQPGGLIYELFDLAHAAERQQKFLADPANHFEWIEVEGGGFWMGDDEHIDNEKPAHRVRVDSFRMAKHSVTNHLISNFPFGAKHSNHVNDNCPTISRTWWEAYYFALWLGAALPTEAEWEYAARGGKHAQSTQYFWGDAVEESSNHAWFGEAERPCAHAVDEVNPRTGKENLNPLGLANILGNVWEWCQDWHGNYDSPKNKNEVMENPRGPKTGVSKIRRGGGFANSSDGLRCARRRDSRPSNRTFDLGFRLVGRASH